MQHSVNYNECHKVLIFKEREEPPELPKVSNSREAKHGFQKRIFGAALRIARSARHAHDKWRWQQFKEHEGKVELIRLN